jgi:hypothetical protein
VIEEVYIFNFPLSFPIASIQTFFQTCWQDRSTALAAAPNIVQFYGKQWDGSTWS